MTAFELVQVVDLDELVAAGAVRPSWARTSRLGPGRALPVCARLVVRMWGSLFSTCGLTADGPPEDVYMATQLGGGFQFSQVPIADIPRSSFNRSHGHKTTFSSGYLVPFFVDEALPGDTFSVNCSLFARLATPIVPIMDNMYMDVFFFFVPNRLVWSNWQRFMGEQPNPGDSTDFLVPQIIASAGGFVEGSIYDYFGLPTKVANISVSALWCRAYNLIYNEWFRDENLANRAFESKGDGPDSDSSYAVQRRFKRHDYFTSCLPWPQKGPGVSLPLGTTAPVIPAGDGRFALAEYPTGAKPAPLHVNVGTNNVLGLSGPASGNVDLMWHIGSSTGLAADLSQATSATINSLRQAFQIQRLLERDARGGTRYTEILRSHFGVISPDARLQRPEYLGGGTIPVMVNPVTQTSATVPTQTPQGNLAAFGVAGGKGIGFTKSFVEHGVLIGLVEVRADLSYQQGINRMWSRRTRYDFYWPAFSHLGEQAVLNKEIYATGVTAGPADDDDVFGYQERWAEYRYYPSKITGKFRSNATGSLDFWHLAQNFTSAPTLSVQFMLDIPPVNRIIAVQTEPEFLFDSHINMRCVRPMPTYSVPGMIDHF